MLNVGAHFVIDSVLAVLPATDAIDEQFTTGRRP
jgi:hypothetical protein